MKVGQLKSGMPHQPLLLLILLSSCLAQNKVTEHSNPLKSLYVPIGAGRYPDVDRLKNEEFGIFGSYLTNEKAEATKGKEFVTCGSVMAQYMNPNFDGKALYSDIVCEPSPGRVIVRVDGKTDTFSKFEHDLSQECELLSCSSNGYPAHNAKIGKTKIKAYQYEEENGQLKPDTQKSVEVTGVDLVAAAPERAETNVCKDKKADYLNGPSSVIFANEDKCYASQSGLKDKLEKANANGEYIQVPRWLGAKESRRNIRSAFYPGEHQNFHYRVPYAFPSQTDMGGLQYKECMSACDSGKVVKMEMRGTAEQKYRLAIILNPKCKSFRICYGAKNFKEDSMIPTCDMYQTIDVQVKNGIVMWPNLGRASLIEFRSPYGGNTNPVVMEFGYGIDLDDGTQASEFYIGNAHREIVSSTSGGFDGAKARQLAFFFPEEDCLQTTGGIFSRHMNYGKSLSTKTLTPGKRFDEDLSSLNAQQDEKPITTTTSSPKDIPSTTTQAAIRANPDAVVSDADKIISNQEKQRAVYHTGKWWTWGIYLGFVIGTLLTLGVGGGLFYVLRRTIFGIWYRGMYKRYGCDASGTTGGITGVGFGNTVTGDVTVQGTTGGTTMGGTTGGTTSTGTSTGTSTMGGTTGATETTTLLDKTEGNKSIAM